MRRWFVSKVFTESSESVFGPLLTNVEAAQLLGCARDTVRSWRSRHGWQKGIHFREDENGRYKYYRDAILDWDRNRGNKVAHLQWISEQLCAEQQWQKHVEDAVLKYGKDAVLQVVHSVSDD
jgi:hypothetical protein